MDRELFGKVLERNYGDLINSRILAVRDYTGGMDPPEGTESNDSLCSKCRRFTIAPANCHLCGNQRCSRCVWYFLLPRKFYSDLYENCDSILPPLTVCWTCHDKCIYNKITSIASDHYEAMRERQNFKRLNGLICFSPPERTKDEEELPLEKRFCVICDLSKCENTCDLCGEFVCNVCHVSVPFQRKEFKEEGDNERLRACNECNYKLMGKFYISNWYELPVSLKDTITKENLDSNIMFDKSEIFLMEIYSIVQSLQDYVEEDLKAGPIYQEDLLECFLCGEKPGEEPPLSKCWFCEAAVCTPCHREFYIPFEMQSEKNKKKRVEEKQRFRRKSSLGEMIENETAEAQITVQPVCLSCHAIALVIRQLFHPRIVLLRHRKSLQVDTKEKIIRLPALDSPTKGKKEHCFFCMKDSEYLRPCCACGECFCSRDLAVVPAQRLRCVEESRKIELNNLFCLECRHLLAVKNYRIDVDEKFLDAQKAFSEESELNSFREEIFGSSKEFVWEEEMEDIVPGKEEDENEERSGDIEEKMESSGGLVTEEKEKEFFDQNVE